MEIAGDFLNLDDTHRLARWLRHRCDISLQEDATLSVTGFRTAGTILYASSEAIKRLGTSWRMLCDHALRPPDNSVVTTEHYRKSWAVVTVPNNIPPDSPPPSDC